MLFSISLPGKLRYKTILQVVQRCVGSKELFQQLPLSQVHNVCRFCYQIPAESDEARYAHIGKLFGNEAQWQCSVLRLSERCSPPLHL